MVQPDRGAKRPREEDGGAAGGDEDARGGKHPKGLSARELARLREAVGVAVDAGGDFRESEELREDRKKILEKLMDQDEEEPEVSETRHKRSFIKYKLSCPHMCKQSIKVQHILFFTVCPLTVMLSFHDGRRCSDSVLFYSYLLKTFIPLHYFSCHLHDFIISHWPLTFVWASCSKTYL